MDTDRSNDRRQFLRNTAIAAVALQATAHSMPIGGSKGNKTVEECLPTTRDFYGEGPFYTDDAPEITNGRLAELNESGQRIIITGHIFNLDCSQVLPNVEIDLWHANDAGEYDNSGYNLRGKTKTNSQGFFTFETIKPGFYLNGTNFRPSHIHIKITPPGSDTLTTQLYFEGDPYIANDAAASITSGDFDATSRIIPLLDNNGVLEGTWNIRIDGEGNINSTNELYVDKGMIYHTAPNPFTDELNIHYGVFRPSKVAISVFDSNGNLVAELGQQTLPPEKYNAIWNPDPNLPAGVYFIALRINDLQVHYHKIVKTE